MKVHFIAIGGSAMHNLALELHSNGHNVTGSDDEIYDPSRSRLENAGLLPEQYGWYTDKINSSIDAVILGMHARKDNPELHRAIELGIPVYSYPEFVAKQSMNKNRVVIAGSHGKTTTTSMILHALNQTEKKYDYLVGAQLKGYNRMVKLSDADLIILEGDEYLSSPIDLRPKMIHYKPNIAVITGIAWDHINVFPTFEDYVEQFRKFIQDMDEEAVLFYYEKDEELQKLIAEGKHKCKAIPYGQVELTEDKNILRNGSVYPTDLVGYHNFQNMQAASLVANELGIPEEIFFNAMSSFEGADRRLQYALRSTGKTGTVFMDFAHAPSKVKASTEAVKSWYEDVPLVAILELHTYSSLNKAFIPQYKGALAAADKAIVFYNQHTLDMKKMPSLSKEFVAEAFDHPNIEIINTTEDLQNSISKDWRSEGVVLLMTSGNFGKTDIIGLLQ